MTCFCRAFLAWQYGSFVGPKTVRVEDVDYTADHILVAVGGKPKMPPMDGTEHCISSDGFFLLEVGHAYMALQRHELTPQKLVSIHGCRHVMNC